MKSLAAGVHVRYESRQHYVMVQLSRLGLQHLAVGSCVKPGLLQLHQSMWHVQGMTAHHEVIAIPVSAQKTIILKSLRYKVASNPLDPPVSMLMGDVCDLAIMIVFFSQEQTIQSISNTQQHWYWGVKGGIVHYHTDDCFLCRHRYSNDALSLFVVILLLWSACETCVRRWNRLGIWDACCNQTNTSVLGTCNACLKPP